MEALSTMEVEGQVLKKKRKGIIEESDTKPVAPNGREILQICANPTNQGVDMLSPRQRRDFDNRRLHGELRLPAAIPRQQDCPERRS